ncbi:MAG: gas vesicle protein [Acidobacteriota bacterium]|nr:gas vesicle protein [Acidobacteriota bacterium]
MPSAGSNVALISSTPDDEVSLVEILDHVLNSGVVIRGSLIISLAGVDLIYLGMDVILTSVETAMSHIGVASPRNE